jgi:hypothetical protein
VEYLTGDSLPENEVEPPAPPPLARLIGRRGHWLDRDGGGGGPVGWAFRESLREAAMRRFVERQLAAGQSPVGEHAVRMTYGPPGSGCDVTQWYFAEATGTVQGHFRVSEIAVQDAQRELDAFFRGPFGVIGGRSSCEAGWYDGPVTSLHKTYEAAVRRYRSVRPGLLHRFLAETQKIVHGIREGWYVPTDAHQLVLVVVRPPGAEDTTELIAGLRMHWTPEARGPGYFTHFPFEPEWTDYFPEAPTE